jgi:hypothetical protein
MDVGFRIVARLRVLCNKLYRNEPQTDRNVSYVSLNLGLKDLDRSTQASQLADQPKTPDY